jgi:hypothetical protein
MEIHTLRDDAAYDTEFAQRSHRVVGGIRPCAVEVRPAEKTPRPVALARRVRGDEFRVVDGPVGAV